MGRASPHREPLPKEWSGIMKKLTWRIPLDILLVFLFTTVFSKNVISLTYHEVIGLALFALILVHVFFLNSAWVKGVAAKLFQRKMPNKTRLIACVDLLLGFSFLLIIISGVLISKKLFGFGLKAPWIVIHFFCTALMIILIGVHLGLHWEYLKSGIGKRLTWLRLPQKAAFVLSALICVFGIYSLFTSSLGNWLSRPFVTFEGHEERSVVQVEVETRTDEQSGRSVARNVDGMNNRPEEYDNAESGGASRHGQQPFSLLRLFNLILTYFSIFFVIGKVINFLDHALYNKKHSITCS